MELLDFPNEPPPEGRITSVGDFLVVGSISSPIDMYHRSLDELIRYGTAARLQENDFSGCLLAIRAIAIAEAYFRAVLAGCIEICPLAQEKCTEQSINLGGLLWHGRKGYTRSAFENSSFSNKEALKKACKDFLAFRLDDSIFQAPLDQFETVCHLRHGIVHGDGWLPGRNAIKLGVKSDANPVRIVIRYEQFQEVAAVINTLVKTLNRALFEAMCKRWAIDWRQRADWEPANQRAMFIEIWNLFLCREELKRRRGRSHITLKKCIAAVEAKYQIPPAV